MVIETKEKILVAVFRQYNENESVLSVHKLAMIADQAYFPRGTIVLGVNQPQPFVYLIVEGLARSYVTDKEGNNIVRNFMLENDFLIGESLFSDTSTEAFDALEDIYCLRFKAEELRQVIMKDEQLKSFYIAILESTLRYKMQREYGFQNLDAKARYEVFKKQFGSAEKRIPQNQIASYIGITKESLSRLRKKLQNR
ncbi:Crp/Fnr family transcriptional regulator [Enterococcus canintestini]|uniref:Cyclic nucleotide-binding protein n=1 Tax=Enterococcus canintestini TaxID=317010 RepID=A0A267HTB1_9ENTE|nr:Crp/Fnr family transcriptional regulator [Enterococcus canintestini]PAB00748.1 cyclic nucleotide-binding protein [Enterococcus canintestini]